jgi:hypothetical protein
VKRLAIMLAALVLGLAVPTLATAQFGPTNVPAPLTQTTDTDTVAPEKDTGLTTLQLVLIFGSAIAVIALIGWLIMRDAHRAAPAPDRKRVPDPAVASGPKNKSAREREREQARKRAKAKAARNQRKRNRPR